MFAPSEETVQSVRAWLVASGIEDTIIVHSDNKGWLAFDIPTWQAEELFQTEYHEHVHANSGNVRVGCDEYRPDCEFNYATADCNFQRLSAGAHSRTCRFHFSWCQTLSCLEEDRDQKKRAR